MRRVIIGRFGAARAEPILQDAGPVYSRFLGEAPSIGGKANVMNQSMDMAPPFFAVYEASGRSLCEAELDEMLDILMVRRFRKAGRLIDMNRLDRPWFRKLVYRLAQKVADQNNAHRGKEWNNTWGIQINPEGHEYGLVHGIGGLPAGGFFQGTRLYGRPAQNVRRGCDGGGSGPCQADPPSHRGPA